MIFRKKVFRWLPPPEFRRFNSQVNSTHMPYQYQQNHCDKCYVIWISLRTARLIFAVESLPRATGSKAIRRERVWWRGAKKVSLPWSLFFVCVSTSPDRSDIPLVEKRQRRENCQNIAISKTLLKEKQTSHKSKPQRLYWWLVSNRSSLLQLKLHLRNAIFSKKNRHGYFVGGPTCT